MCKACAKVSHEANLSSANIFYQPDAAQQSPLSSQSYKRNLEKKEFNLVDLSQGMFQPFKVRSLRSKKERDKDFYL